MKIKVQLDVDSSHQQEVFGFSESWTIITASYGAANGGIENDVDCMDPENHSSHTSWDHMNN